MANRLSKRQQNLREKLNPTPYSIDEALQFCIDNSKVKFVERVDVAVILGVDPKKSDQVVRGRCILPNGTGKQGLRIAVFAKGEQADAAKAAGAHLIGFEDLAEQVKQDGKIDCDIILATPEAMRVVGTLGQILGPRGLMPNPKEGTVTNDMTTAIKNAVSGVRFRTDKNANVHCAIGTVKMTAQMLKENLHALMADLKKHKPATSKGSYIRKVCISTTMGVGLPIDLSSLEA